MPCVTLTKETYDLGGVMAENHGAVILRRMNQAQLARLDTTALLLAKMVAIGTQNDKPYFRVVDDIIHANEGNTDQRIENVIHTLVGYVVQLSEGRMAAQGFLALCSWLSQRMVENRLDETPGMTESWRT